MGLLHWGFQMFIFEMFIPTLSKSCLFFTVSKWWSIIFRSFSWLTRHDMSRSDIEDFKSDLHGKSNTEKLKLLAWFLCVFLVFFLRCPIPKFKHEPHRHHQQNPERYRNVTSFEALQLPFFGLKVDQLRMTVTLSTENSSIFFGGDISKKGNPFSLWFAGGEGNS